jgi:hypothetical protein
VPQRGEVIRDLGGTVHVPDDAAAGVRALAHPHLGLLRLLLTFLGVRDDRHADLADAFGDLAQHHFVDFLVAVIDPGPWLQPHSAVRSEGAEARMPVGRSAAERRWQSTGEWRRESHQQ